ncbi:BQ5605_C052g12585 [Microbotryum silenes-dioicae]|uniref:BQ5605_C052g12585 protein n=1 Tax=Microbotryum silenes-dioicae TaxID=796604 RepID=A0A2X0PHH3_9BASI|nr:BQ5605_C052g12585 [Microbotryum silenes-dioicae]
MEHEIMRHRPDAIDLSHHLSLLARSRMSSPLKGMYKYFGRPGMLMLAGGLPSPDYFPFDSISAHALVPNSYKTTEATLSSWLWSFFKPTTTTITIPKYIPNATLDQIQLSSALQYGTAVGIPSLAKFIKDFTELVFRPGYANYETLVNAGSTDAWSKICTTLLERGDGFLCEQNTYPSALSTAWPSGFRPIPLPMDGAGFTPEGLQDLLEDWDVFARGGMRRPRVLYTVPVCQNPTGATMTAARKQQIYDICVKYDVIIVEDDPYYFLQAGEYEPVHLRGRKTSKSLTETDEEFLQSLVPSFLRYDYQGRVIRIDTFSKTICPGARMGWTTGHPLLMERMQRANESSSQAASGFSQALITKLLVEEWGMKGFLRWLKGLKAQYRIRRDTLVDSLLVQGHASLDTRSVVGRSDQFLWVVKHQRDEKGFIALSEDEKVLRRGSDESTILSFVAPQGGMFVWLRIHLSNHPLHPSQSTSSFIFNLWEQLAENNVLVAPGTMFDTDLFGQPLSQSTDPEFASSGLGEEQERMPVTDLLGQGIKLMQDGSGDGYFRLAFSSASKEEMEKACKIIGKVVTDFFEAPEV